MRSKLVLLWMLCGCGAQAPRIGQFQSPIVGGTLDPADPSVVAVYAQTSATQGSICTGEVVSPHMVLTAAHCVDPAVLKTSSAVFSIFLGSDLNDAAQVNDPANFIAASSTDFDPLFDVNQLGGGHDIGEVTTAEAIPRALLPVHHTPLDGSFMGSPLRIVGFGINTSTDTQGTSAGTRRKNTTSVMGVDSVNALIYSGDATHNICEGDSGGPGFITIGGTETIVGVASFVNQDCSSGAHTDVGAYYSTFIEPHISAAEGAAQQNADLSTLPGGGDDAGTTDPTTLGAGQLCAADSDCSSGICASAGKTRYCSQSCNLDDATTCPSTMKCKIVSGAPYCVFPAKGGCSATAAGSTPLGAPGPAGGFLVLLGIAGVVHRRRRRIG